MCDDSTSVFHGDDQAHLRAALDIVKSQAGVAIMSASEIMQMLISVADGIKAILDEQKNANPPSALEAVSSVSLKSITCLICGRSFKSLAIHLMKHEITAEEYRTRFGFPPDFPLVCRRLRQQRKESMNKTRMWEWRKAARKNLSVDTSAQPSPIKRRPGRPRKEKAEI